jgi:hypothetical protein
MTSYLRYVNHSLSAVFFTWFLLIPPSSYDPTWGTGKMFDTEKPLAEWILVGEFNTQDECIAMREQNRLAMALRGNADAAQRFNLGRCVAK